MDIRKADSKGRITGFLPGQHYAFDWEKGYVAKIKFHAPDGRPLADAIRQDLKIAELGFAAKEQLSEALNTKIARGDA